MFTSRLKKISNLFDSQQTVNKLEHLDGLRGFSALIVVLHHFHGFVHPPNRDYRLFVGFGSYVAVTGFFILSAFLLTYRLMVDFERAQNYKICILKIVQYVLRRFFRIYVGFILFLIIFYNFPKSIDVSDRPGVVFEDAILLDSKIGAHLWTVPIEIKYYFCIPAISLCAYKFGKYWYLFAAMFIPVICVLEYEYPEPGEIPILRCVNIFLKGSFLGILYYHYKKSKKVFKFISKNKVQAIITPILVCITFIQFKYLSYYFNPNINLTLRNIGSTLMFIEIGLLLVSEQPNAFTKFFNAPFLKSCGKFSFGIYLFHFIVLGCLNFIRDVFADSSDSLFGSLFIGSFVGFIWFFIIKPQLMKISSRFCTICEQLKYFFASTIDYVFAVVVTAYFVGAVWFYLVENPLMKVANRLCKKCEQLQCFRLTNEAVQVQLV